MISDVVLGLQWGDEGKGKIVNWIQTQARYDWVVRMAGGNNAGHTIHTNGIKYVTHFIPSIRVWAEEKAFLGRGMVIDPKALLEEVKQLDSIRSEIGNRIFVDRNAFLITEKHKVEDSRDVVIGTTKKGIGPAYTDKISRKGIKIYEAFNSDLKEKEYLAELQEYGVRFIDTIDWKERAKDSTVLFEGAQGILLDVDLGDYPYVTSSNCSMAPIVASGMAHRFRHVFGVFKAYATRVGNGPFRTEIEDKEVADKLVDLGGEYGSTTGRKRRVGWLDLPLLKYAVEVGGITDLIVTKKDVLDSFVNDKNKAFAFCGELDGVGYKDLSNLNLDEFNRLIKHYTGRNVVAYSFGPDTKDTKNLMSIM